MSSQSATNARTARRNLREKSRENVRKLRSENRDKINKSIGTAYCAFREVRSTARQTLASVKTAVENISNRCLQGGRSRTKYRLRPGSYSPLGCQTPVRLYSPFGIETPSPATPQRKTPNRRTPKTRALGTPARKLREELKEIETGIGELNAVAEKISKRPAK
ncbi:hypothetical protein V5799_026862 [Amblyomma americanum]|uniref:Uncharacterized protein n=1 Tax=Amblyomma americanum TaxID=6943 RepID=A0AAQ4DHC5_AMBAM